MSAPAPITVQRRQKEIMQWKSLGANSCLAGLYFKQQQRPPQPSKLFSCECTVRCVFVHRQVHRGTAASLPSPFKTEHRRTWIVLAAAFWSCLWLSFLGGTGAGKLGWVADGVKQERRQCLFANMSRCRSITAQRSWQNQCGSFLPATAAPQRCTADESTPTQEQVSAPEVLLESVTSRSKRGEIHCQAQTRMVVLLYFKASTGCRWQAFSQPASLAVCFSSSPSSEMECYQQAERNATHWCAGRRGTCVSLHPHSGFQAFGTRTQLLLFTLSTLQSAGLWGDVTAFQWWHERGSAHVCSHGRSLPGGSLAADPDRDPACMRSILQPIWTCSCWNLWILFT